MTDLGAPVATLVTVTVAPETAAPVESVTSPVIPPWVCAKLLTEDVETIIRVIIVVNIRIVTFRI
jgi:hypothetical protein